MITEEKIWEYIDGTADEQLRAELEYAIAHDADSAALFADLSAMQSMLKAQPAERLSGSFTDRVMDGVYPAVSEAEPEANWFSLLGYAVPYILVAMLLAMACFGGGGLPSSSYLSPRIISSFKVIFILGDVVLLMYFLDEWFYTKRNRLA